MVDWEKWFSIMNALQNRFSDESQWERAPELLYPVLKFDFGKMWPVGSIRFYKFSVISPSNHLFWFLWNAFSLIVWNCNPYRSCSTFFMCAIVYRGVIPSSHYVMLTEHWSMLQLKFGHYHTILSFFINLLQKWKTSIYESIMCNTLKMKFRKLRPWSTVHTYIESQILQDFPVRWTKYSFQSSLDNQPPMELVSSGDRTEPKSILCMITLFQTESF